jgi:ATP-binding cassette, subfamily B, bacterial PglK
MKAVDQTHLLERLWRQISRACKIQLAIMILLMVIVAFAEVISIGAIMPFLTVLVSPDLIFHHRMAGPIIEIFGVTEAKQLMFPVTIAFVVAVIIANGLRMLLYWLQLHLAYRIGSDFSKNIFEHTLYQPYSTHLEKNSSEIIATIISKSESIVGQVVLPSMVMMSSVIILLAITVTLVFLNPALTFLGLFSLILTYVLIAKFFKKSISIQGVIINEKSTKLIKVIQESLGGIRDVIIDGTQKAYCRIFQEVDQPLKKAHAAVFAMIGMPRFVIEGLGVCAIAVLAYQLTVGSSVPQATIPILGVLVLCAQRLLPLLQQGYASWTSMHAGKMALADSLTLLESPLPSFASEGNAKVKPMQFFNEIVFSDIRFSYYPNQLPVLNGIHLAIPKGARIGVIGVTGGGKSTLLDLLMGLLSPTHGEILVDGCCLGPEAMPSWQACISHVPQTVYIADATVAENIAFGVSPENINLDEVLIAAQQACIAEVIEALPMKYNTRVGERGARLSGGQRQRIGIARALYKRSQIIIFDEATSALDIETERLVMDSLSDLGRDLTLVIVAHRLSTLKVCDQIVRLDLGVVKEIISYDDLPH